MYLPLRNKNSNASQHGRRKTQCLFPPLLGTGDNRVHIIALPLSLTKIADVPEFALQHKPSPTLHCPPG